MTQLVRKTQASLLLLFIDYKESGKPMKNLHHISFHHSLYGNQKMQLHVAGYPWERLSRYLTKNRAELWNVLGKTFPLVSEMHSLGVTHLDLNLGNILIDTNSKKLAVIDFEFGPVEWVNKNQQMAFDYLRLIDDCLKPRRGGKILLKNPEKLVELLKVNVTEGTKKADLHFVYSKLQRLEQQPQLCKLLQTIFTHLPTPKD
ncbi:hypothetical protein GQR58_021982 [Nymphon striatum]|nr:hypothetical protein GQR58_021982 [Nymphon striatum]